MLHCFFSFQAIGVSKNDYYGWLTRKHFQEPVIFANSFARLFNVGSLEAMEPSFPEDTFYTLMTAAMSPT